MKADPRPPEAIVLLHGFGSNGHIFDDLAPALPGPVLRPDLPGHGRCPPVSLHRWMETLWRTLPDRVALVGWSLGGQVALGLQACAPERVSRLVLLAATPCFVAQPDWPAGMAAATFETFATGMMQDEERALIRFAGLLAGGQPRIRQRVRAAWAEGGKPHRAGLEWGLDSLRRGDWRTQIATLRCPLLIIQGQTDPLVSPAAGAWMHAAAGAPARLCTLESGHLPFVEEAETVVREIREFVHAG